MTSGINHQIKLAARPVGLPKRSDWQFTEAPIRSHATAKS
jgi:NADPH-dependent curcumin reductase